MNGVNTWRMNPRGRGRSSSGTPVVTPPVAPADTSDSYTRCARAGGDVGYSGSDICSMVSVLSCWVLVSSMVGKLWQYYQTHESTDDAYVVSDIVPLSPQVNGMVLAVYVVDNQTVEPTTSLPSSIHAILRRALNKWKPQWLWRSQTCVGPRSRCG